MRIVTLVTALIFYASGAHAGAGSYVCTVAAFNRLTNEGILTADSKDPIIGKEFAVDRSTGKIIGRYIGTQGFNTQVLDSGSDNQSFKMLATNPVGFLHVLYLEIQEFNKGLKKPFLLVDAAIVYSGSCQ